MKIKRRKDNEPDKGHNRAGVFHWGGEYVDRLCTIWVGTLSMKGWVGWRDECIKQLEKYPESNDNETSLLVIGGIDSEASSS